MEKIKDYEAMAKLELSENEREKIQALASRLIDSFRAVLDTPVPSNTQPMYTVLDIQNVLREDVCVKTISREKLLSNAPAEYEGYFQVPKTL